MILIGRYLSPFVRRVGISMQLLDIPFERKELSTKDDREELAKINPLGRVPALLLDDGEILIDSSTMLDYLDQQVGPERALVPAKGAARRQVLNGLGLMQGIFDKALAFNFERNNHPEEQRNQAWMDRCQQQVKAGFAALEESSQAPWLIGEKMTQADITLICAWDMTTAIMPTLFEDNSYPKLQAVVDRCNDMNEVTSTRFVR